MLFLLFQLGEDRYALEAGRAVEVIPFVALKKIPHAPHGVAGVFNYRGRPVPAVDLCELTFGRPARELLSTRIIIVALSPLQASPLTSAPTGEGGGGGRGRQKPVSFSDPQGRAQWTGLIAEHATGMIRREPGQFVSAGVKLGHAPYLGPVIMDEKGVIQLLHPEHLLAENVRQLLRTETEALSHESD